MKFNSHKREEQKNVLCGGRNSKYRAEQKGNREDGYTHAESSYPWKHQRLGWTSNICSEEPDLGEDVPAYFKGLNPMIFRALSHLCRGSMIWKLSE